MRGYVELFCFATANRDTFRKPYSNTCGHNNLDRILNSIVFDIENSTQSLQTYELLGSQFVEQSPLQTILLYGVTALRVMLNEAWARRKALKSRQRAIFVILEASAPRQRHFLLKIS